MLLFELNDFGMNRIRKENNKDQIMTYTGSVDDDQDDILRALKVLCCIYYTYYTHI